MNKYFLKFLIDPLTGENLKLTTKSWNGKNVEEGNLVSSSNSYPIVRGVPRFAGYNLKRNYAKSFGFEWNKWSKIQFESANKGKPMMGHTQKMWEKITGISRKKISGKLVIDYGCGPGRFIELCSESGATVIGLDLSDAVEVAAQNFRHNDNVLICQADVLKPPIKPEIADYAFSIGVLHHTANPSLGFEKIAKTVKPNGELAVSVYNVGSYYGSYIVNLYRRIFQILWPIFGPYPALAYSHISVYIFHFLRKIPSTSVLRYTYQCFFPCVYLSDLQWSILDTFDSLTPSYQSRHTPYEVFSWFKKNGFGNITPSDWGGASFHAKKNN